MDEQSRLRRIEAAEHEQIEQAFRQWSEHKDLEESIERQLRHIARLSEATAWAVVAMTTIGLTVALGYAFFS